MLVRASRNLLHAAAAGVQHLAGAAQHVADGLDELAGELQLLADQLTQLLDESAQHRDDSAQRAAEFLSIEQVAKLAGVRPATIRAYRTRRQMPPPVARYGQSPVWRTETITAWLASQGKAPVDRLSVVTLPHDENRDRHQR